MATDKELELQKTIDEIQDEILAQYGYGDGETFDQKYAPIEHNHNEYSSKGHTHSEYAKATHTHTSYASRNHTHTQYADKEHTHSQYADKEHTHSQYAAKLDEIEKNLNELEEDIDNIELNVDTSNFITQEQLEEELENFKSKTETSSTEKIFDGTTPSYDSKLGLWTQTVTSTSSKTIGYENNYLKMYTSTDTNEIVNLYPINLDYVDKINIDLEIKYNQKSPTLNNYLSITLYNDDLSTNTEILKISGKNFARNELELDVSQYSGNYRIRIKQYIYSSSLSCNTYIYGLSLVYNENYVIEEENYKQINLYNFGAEHEYLIGNWTGGYYSSGYSYKTESTCLKVEVSKTTGDWTWTTTNKINFENLVKIELIALDTSTKKFNDGEGGVSVRIMESIHELPNSDTTVLLYSRLPGFSQRKIIIDVPKTTGEHYIGIRAWNGSASLTHTLEIYRVKLYYKL